MRTVFFHSPRSRTLPEHLSVPSFSPLHLLDCPRANASRASVRCAPAVASAPAPVGDDAELARSAVRALAGVCERDAWTCARRARAGPIRRSLLGGRGSLPDERGA